MTQRQTDEDWAIDFIDRYSPDDFSRGEYATAKAELLERLTAERAAIVAWLRALPPPWDERVDPETVTYYVADAIEAGEHLKPALH